MLLAKSLRVIPPLFRLGVHHSTTASRALPSTSAFIPLSQEHLSSYIAKGRKNSPLLSRNDLQSMLDVGVKGPAHPLSIPSIDWERHSLDQAETILSHAAATTGIAMADNLRHAAPFKAIRALFDKLYVGPALGQRLNATYPKRGVFKHAGLSNATVDQKVTIDLSASRLHAMREAAPELAEELGAGFEDTLAFFESVETQLVPLLLRATSARAGMDLAAVHNTKNHNYRLIDYAPQLNNGAARCGEHRDYGTFTLIFQDGHGGLEYQGPDGTWHAVSGSGVVAVWGWSAVVLSGDRIVAANHRVRRTAPGVRRNTAVFFVAPGLDAPLRPLSSPRHEAKFADAVLRGEVTVAEFKEVTGKKWRVREGNEKDDEGDHGHDDAVKAFVRGSQASIKA